MNTRAEEIDEIMEPARTSLHTIVKAIEEHPGSGPTGWLVKFLAGVYNGHEFPFDLSPDEERPLVHARLLSETVAKPLSGNRWPLERANVRFSAYDVSRVLV